MDVPKYARIEAERRFLVVAAAMPDLAAVPFDRIEDRYLDGSRLRVRAMTAPDGARVFKLCKKYEPLAPSLGAIVNVYLDADEYRMLAALPGRDLVKRRYGLMDAGKRVVIDVFEGALDGLVLTEFEETTAAAVAARPAPPWAGAEVTHDPAYAGFALARRG